MADGLTKGVHHVGLTVKDLEASAGFFEQALGFDRIGGRPEYPSLFISDGTVMLTLWQSKTDDPVPFDRTTNIGLHHVALLVRDRAALDAAFTACAAYPGAKIEFPPEPLGGGPREHTMLYEPSGNRVELVYDPG